MTSPRTFLTPLLLLGLLGSASSLALGERRPPVLRTAQGTTDAEKDELQSLRAAAQVLANRGYKAEAARIQEVLTQLEEHDAAPKKAPTEIEAEAKELLRLDVDDRAARARMLDLIADGFGTVGDGTSAEALRFFASVSRVEKARVHELQMPRSLVAGEATLLVRLVMVIRSAGDVFPGIDCTGAAKLAEKLDRFYVARESSRSEPTGSELALAKLRSMGYLDDEETPVQNDDLIDLLVRVGSLQHDLARHREGVAETTEEMSRLEVRLLLHRDRS